MGIREIPKAFEYTCDACGAKDLQQNANGHYTDSRPPHWSRLKIARTAYDYQGSACADASLERLLCSGCSETVYAAVNKSLADLRGHGRVTLTGNVKELRPRKKSTR